MKVLYCPICHDFLKIRDYPQVCGCGASNAWFSNASEITSCGKGVILGIVKDEFQKAISRKSKWSSEFSAYVVPKNACAIKQLKIDDYFDTIKKT